MSTIWAPSFHSCLVIGASSSRPPAFLWQFFLLPFLVLKSTCQAAWRGTVSKAITFWPPGPLLKQSSSRGCASRPARCHLLVPLAGNFLCALFFSQHFYVCQKQTQSSSFFCWSCLEAKLTVDKGMCWSGCWRWVCLPHSSFFSFALKTLNEEDKQKICKIKKKIKQKVREGKFIRLLTRGR